MNYQTLPSIEVLVNQKSSSVLFTRFGFHFHYQKNFLLWRVGCENDDQIWSPYL